MNIRRELKTVNRQIRNTVARGIVELSDASKMLQSLQVTVLKDEVLDNVEHFEQQGFTARPKKGAEVILLSPGGNRSSAIAIMVADRRIRIKDLGEGEVAMYDDANNLIHFKQDNTIAVKADTSVDVTAPDVTMTGNLTVDGDITAGGDVADSAGHMQEMRDAHNAHKHAYTDDGSPMTTAVPDTLMN